MFIQEDNLDNMAIRYYITFAIQQNSHIIQETVSYVTNMPVHT